MADRVIDRGHEQTEEEREHQRQMSERMRALLAGEDLSAPATPASNYEAPALRSEHVPAYQNAAYETSVYHAPVVPASPDAPSPARRLADYVPITVGMQSLQRFGDMPSAPAASVKDYAPVEAAPAPGNEPAARGGLFDTLLYKDGELLDTAAPVMPEAARAPEMAVPVYEPVQAPAYSPETYSAPMEEPVYTPAAPSYDEDDSKPTPRTMSHQNAAEERNASLLAALSLRTKLVLAAVAAVIIVLLAVICVNTAIINSLNEEVETREEELTRLTEQLSDIDSEITDLTSRENIENWAIEHGMSR